MPNIAIENTRMTFRIKSEEKSLLMRAAEIENSNLTEFVLTEALSKARKVISEYERISLSERDSLHVMELLDNPPAPNKKLLLAAFSLPKN